MKRFLICAAMSLATLAATTPALASNVGIAINVGQPGFFGQLDIGGYAPPPVMNVQPVFIGQMPPPDQAPIYLRVPPEHQRHWDRYCHHYHACGQRVYFVREDWYNRQYAPRYRREHGNDQRNDPRYGYDHGNNHDNRDNRGDRGDQGRPQPWDNGQPRN